MKSSEQNDFMGAELIAKDKISSEGLTRSWAIVLRSLHGFSCCCCYYSSYL